RCPDDRLCRRRHRRHGLDPRVDCQRVRARNPRGDDEGRLPGSLIQRHFRRDGSCHPDEALWPVREVLRALMSNTQLNIISVPDVAAFPDVEPPSRGSHAHFRWMFIALALALLVIPAFVYPVFLMKVMCFALFAVAFNLLLGSCGLLSLGH